MSKNQLQTYLQRRGLAIPSYETKQISIEPPIWVSTVSLDTGKSFEGEARRRKVDAETSAAKHALEGLEILDRSNIDIEKSSNYTNQPSSPRVNNGYYKVGGAYQSVTTVEPKMANNQSLVVFDLDFCGNQNQLISLCSKIKPAIDIVILLDNTNERHKNFKNKLIEAAHDIPLIVGSSDNTEMLIALSLCVGSRMKNYKNITVVSKRNNIPSLMNAFASLDNQTNKTNLKIVTMEVFEAAISVFGTGI